MRGSDDSARGAFSGKFSDADFEHSRHADWLVVAERAGRPFVSVGSPALHNAVNLTCLGLLLGALPLLHAVLAGVAPRAVLAAILGLAGGVVIFSLFTLVVHEASHDRFLIVRSSRWRRRLNDAFGRAVCVLFFRDYDTHWRRGHLLHHRRALQADDPQNCDKYVLEGRALIAKLAKVWLFPLYELEFYRIWMRHLDDRCPSAAGAPRFSMTTRTLLFAIGWTLILYYPLRAAPLLTVVTTLIAFKTATSLNFLKSSFEHGGGYAGTDDARLRTRGLVFPLRNLLFPFCVTPYHWEHHLVPAIPWYGLPAFRRAVRTLVPAGPREWIYTPGPHLLRCLFLPRPAP